MVRTFLASLILLYLPGCGKESVQPAPNIFSDPGLDQIIAQYQAEHPELKKPLLKDSLSKSNQPPPPIQREILKQIHPSMTEGEIMWKLGKPIFSYSQKEEDVTAQALFYCIVPINQIESKRELSTPKLGDESPIPIVIENGVVIGIGWEFLREYFQSRPLILELLSEKTLNESCRWAYSRIR
jgi:hypothetical protein